MGFDLIRDYVSTYLIVVSAGGFLLMGFDKLSAKLGSRRIPEALFFMVSVVGGFIGVVLGMLVFHHKTSKRGFELKILATAVLSVLMLFLLGLL